MLSEKHRKGRSGLRTRKILIREIQKGQRSGAGHEKPGQTIRCFKGHKQFFFFRLGDFIHTCVRKRFLQFPLKRADQNSVKGHAVFLPSFPTILHYFTCEFNISRVLTYPYQFRNKFVKNKLTDAGCR